MHLWIYLMALAVFPGCAEWTAYRYFDDAVVYERARQTEAALEAFQEAVAASPEDAYLHRHLGMAFLRRERYEEAQAELERALEIEPDYVEAYRDLAMVFEVQKLPGAAAGWLERAVR
ncbi:MAG: tetratricopeptide repeat protein, partial [bacterium]|nr:tetratricopeptide repeat protein [bacterium]